MTKIYACNRGSTSARKLGEVFNKEVVVLKRGEYPQDYDDVFINWGCSWLDGYGVRLLNIAQDIDFMRNKIAVLQYLSNLNAPVIPHTTQKMVAATWEDVIVRHLVKSTNSKGIEKLDVFDKIPDAPLYTEYKEGKEYRVFVIYGSVSSIYLKSPLMEFPCNKWKFIKLKGDQIKGVASDLVSTFKGQWPFFAVDFLLDKNDTPYILEVNSSPLLFPSVIKDIKHAYSIFTPPL